MVNAKTTIYTLSFRSDNPIFRNSINIGRLLKEHGFKHDHLTIIKNFSNENEYERMAFLIYLEFSQWSTDSSIGLQLGSFSMTSAKRIYHGINPWSNDSSFQIGNIIFYLTINRKNFKRHLMNLNVRNKTMNIICIFFNILSKYYSRSITNKLMHMINGIIPMTFIHQNIQAILLKHKIPLL